MSEGGTSSSSRGSFAKTFQKRVVRTKEKVLQNLGKSDKTHDSVFNDHAVHFGEQQNAANKLQKELKNYIQCVKDMSQAHCHFYGAIKEAYEEPWHGYREIETAVENLGILWEDYLKKLVEMVQAPLLAYTTRFPETKKKIEKRGRKVVDYDHSRHTVDQLQNSKKRDDAKIAKAQEVLRETKYVYEELNTELLEELPMLYESRVGALSSNFHSLFSTEAKFAEETSKVYWRLKYALMGELADITEHLSRTSGADGFRPAILSTPHSHRLGDNDGQDLSAVQGSSTFYNVSLDSSSPAFENKVSTSDMETAEKGSSRPDSVVEAQATTNGEVDAVGHTEESTYEPISVGAQLDSGSDHHDSQPSPTPGQASALYGTVSDTDDIYRVPTSNNLVDPSKLPAGVLFQVEGTHPYTGEDVDELTFDVGETINVVPFEDPDDQDEGWLYGIKTSNGDKGVFPENFTKRI